MSIPANQVRGAFTQSALARYQEMTSPTLFLKSFFPSAVKSSRYLSIEVRRGTEKIAVDVVRGADGNRNQGTRSTEKIFDPPLYNEYFDMTDLTLYDRLWGSTEIDAGVFRELSQESAEMMMMMRNKIERSYEKQCADALTTGIITLQNGDNIDFKRKAGSLVDNSANPWSNNATNPFTQLAAAAKWLRQNGKASGTVFNAIMGESVLPAFYANTIVLAQGDVRRIDTLNIREPQRNSVGATSHGYVSAGDYIFNLWTYPQFYDNASGVSTSYLDAKKVIVIPESPVFEMGFGAVPRVISADGGIANATGEYIYGEYVDARKKAHIMEVQSAGVAIPKAIDQIYTMQVLA